ncbi:MAG: hypothetical protein Q4G07_03115 [Oscillospiraceae bacterium]|nr:hypothetical protein [Oscillospiraceae bacterium]
MKTGKNRLRTRLPAFILCFLLAASLSVANAEDILREGAPHYDASHGHMFWLSGNQNAALNQYAAGAPYNGAPVTTWTKILNTNSPDYITQQWDLATLSNGNWLIVTNQNRSLTLDFNRNYNTPEVQVYTYIDNYYRDCTVKQHPVGSTGPILLAGRPGFGITVTTERTALYDPNGFKCRWTTAPSSFKHAYDGVDY